MATVTTAIVLEADSRTYSSPAARAVDRGSSPIRTMIFTDQTTIALKDAANESFVTISATLPSNFFYRIKSMRFHAASTTLGVFADWTTGMAGLITENQVQVYDFAVWNESGRIDATNSDGSTNFAFKINQDAVTNDFGCFFSPLEELSVYLIDASQGVSIITLRWLDTSSDSTAATVLRSRIEVDAFTIDQANAFETNRSQLIYT